MNKHSVAGLMRRASDGNKTHYIYEHDWGWNLTMCRKVFKGALLGGGEVTCYACLSARRCLLNSRKVNAVFACEPKTPGIRFVVTKQSRKPMHHGR